MGSHGFVHCCAAWVQGHMLCVLRHSVPVPVIGTGRDVSENDLTETGCDAIGQNQGWKISRKKTDFSIFLIYIEHCTYIAKI